MIDFGSVCSGIESVSVAVEPLGWSASWFAEIEAFPSAVLAHHYPDVPNLGDMTKIAREILQGRVHAPSLLVGGTPCQAFSVAGMRSGLEDARGQPITPQVAGVRRLTPRECERLQGFPDDYTMIPWRGKPADECPDGPRYKAIGNSKAVPVVRWIARRIDAQVRRLSHANDNNPAIAGREAC